MAELFYQIEFTILRVEKRDDGTTHTNEEVHTLEAGNAVTAYRCAECEATVLEREEERLYECTECSKKFGQSDGGGRNGNMCPDCGNKFGTKVADEYCAECREGEVETVEAVECPYCQQAVPNDEFVQHCVDDHAGEILGQ